MFICIDVKPPWRNGLAYWTSNSKVVGSSPTGGGIFLFRKYVKGLSFNSAFIFHSARVVKCKPFLVPRREVMLSGLPCVERRNWERHISRACFS